MPSCAVQVSIDSNLLGRVDADEETRRDGRSAVVRRALEAYLKAKEAAAIDAALLASYREIPDIVDDDLLTAQAWPKD